MDPSTAELIDSRMRLIESLPVVRGYYLVLGGGKVGKKFVEYARKHNLPFVLVIDIDDGAPASNNARLLQEQSLLPDIIASLALRKTCDHCPESGPEGAGRESDIYFYRMDVKEVPSLLACGIPEYIIPAIPSHAAVDIVADFLSSGQSREVVSEVSIDGSDRDSTKFFESMVSAFPEDIVAGVFPEHGAIFLSYARPGETCPDNCKGQKGYCYSFKRIKPRTITSYVREFARSKAGWVFESYQMGPGIGGIHGIDLKENLLSIMEFIKGPNKKSLTSSTGKRTFFIATTCNCHGILNLLYVK